MATPLELSEKGGQIGNIRSNVYHNGENLVKIGPADPEFSLIKCLFSLRGMHARWLNVLMHYFLFLNTRLSKEIVPNFLERVKIESQICNLQSNTYHMVKIW